MTSLSAEELMLGKMLLFALGAIALILLSPPVLFALAVLTADEEEPEA